MPRHTCGWLLHRHTGISLAVERKAAWPNTEECAESGPTFACLEGVDSWTRPVQCTMHAFKRWYRFAAVIMGHEGHDDIKCMYARCWMLNAGCWMPHALSHQLASPAASLASSQPYIAIKHTHIDAPACLLSAIPIQFSHLHLRSCISRLCQRDCHIHLHSCLWGHLSTALLRIILVTYMRTHQTHARHPVYIIFPFLHQFCWTHLLDTPSIFRLPNTYTVCFSCSSYDLSLHLGLLL